MSNSNPTPQEIDAWIAECDAAEIAVSELEIKELCNSWNAKFGNLAVDFDVLEPSIGELLAQFDAFDEDPIPAPPGVPPHAG